MSARVPTRSFELALWLRFEALHGWDPVAAAHDFDHEPTQEECVRSQVLQAIPGVLPDERGDEAATLVECRELPGLSLDEVGWLLRRAKRWHPADPMAESISSKLAALADAMERYEGEGDDA